MPAEQLGLIKIDRTGLRFSHPLVRSAIYHTAPFARRAAAHRELANALPTRCDWDWRSPARSLAHRTCGSESVPDVTAGPAAPV